MPPPPPSLSRRRGRALGGQSPKSWSRLPPGKIQPRRFTQKIFTALDIGLGAVDFYPVSNQGCEVFMATSEGTPGKFSRQHAPLSGGGSPNPGLEHPALSGRVSLVSRISLNYMTNLVHIQQYQPRTHSTTTMITFLASSGKHRLELSGGGGPEAGGKRWLCCINY